MKMLHMNDNVIENTFVYAMIVLSKWLGTAYFPHSVFGNWPPDPPAGLLSGASDVVPLNIPSAFVGGDIGGGAAASSSDGTPPLLLGAITTGSDRTSVPG